MTDYLGQLKRFSFDGIVLPYQRIRVRGGLRDHVHEYPHVPGGLAEKFGRKLYEVTVSLKIDEGIARSGFYKGRNLITGLNTLQFRFEEGRTAALYLPNLGEIKAYATSWDRDLDVRVRTGEAFEIAFREDNDSAYLLQRTLSIKPPESLAQYVGDFEARMPQPPPNLFQSIRDAVNQLLAFRDQSDLWASFVAWKLEGLVALFNEADASVKELNDPNNVELLAAFRALWASVVELANTAGLATEVGTYVTPRDMDCQAISLAIYHDTAHAIDVMNLNAIEDPYAVPAATTIKYLKAAA